MANYRSEIEEIKAMLSSSSHELKISAYPKLLHLQQQISTVDSSSSSVVVVDSLAESSLLIISSLLHDIFHNDEEIAAQALKCLGFMIYHPTIVASISGDDASIILESLVKVVVTTKIKSVCNLGIWCISIQQFSVALLDQHIDSLIRAVIHALDNPIGSLSTTFEAMQAVVKLTGSLGEKMRNMAHVWAPPIYRRLVSVDKRDRDMSERCMLKIMPVISPPPITLSKALAVDMKKKLLSAMKELLDQGLKIQSLQAWGWFIRMLGPYAMKNKLIVNDMLKILEKTFSDTDSQVQIASLVTWECLIDAFTQYQAQTCTLNETLGNEAHILGTGHNGQAEAIRHVKVVKLIMAPLIGIMSSKCDVSVHASCLTTWSYLLYKLKDSTNCQSIIENAWKPIIEIVFRVGPDKKNIWFFNFSLDLLEALILGRSQGTDGQLVDHETSQLSLRSAVGVRLTAGKSPLKHYPISCTSWKLSQIDFFIEMICIMVNREPFDAFTPECEKLANDASVRLFGSLLESVQRAFRSVSITYEDIMQSLNKIFRFLGEICTRLASVRSDAHCTHACLKFLEVVTYKLESSILESPLYKVGLDCELIKNLELDVDIRSDDKVLPVVYLTSLYFSVVMNTSQEESKYELLLQHMQGFVKFLLSSYCSDVVLRVFISLLNKSTLCNGLRLWVAIANCLNDCIGSRTLKLDTENNCYSHVLLCLLQYPFASWSSAPVNFDPQIIVEAWKLLYVSVDQYSETVHGPSRSFSEDICAMLNVLQLKEKNISVTFLLLYGGVVIGILGQLGLNLSSIGNPNIERDDRKSISNHMELADGFMKLLWVNKGITEPSFLSITQRFFAELVKLIRCLGKKEHTVLLIEGFLRLDPLKIDTWHLTPRVMRNQVRLPSVEIAARKLHVYVVYFSKHGELGCKQMKTISSSLLLWLSDMHLHDDNTKYQLGILWSDILKCLKQSQPPVKFDSSCLNRQAPLLEKTLDHPNPSISKSTIDFWNSTYGTQTRLDFPQNLLPVLDKLSRNGKISLFSRNQFIGSTTTLKKCSKRVEIVGNPELRLNSKRKRPELTEHQKEVRRAQQGRTMDCSGHGPGIRTYTTVDFSQGNEESQESQDIRDAESILERLRKV